MARHSRIAAISGASAILALGGGLIAETQIGVAQQPPPSQTPYAEAGTPQLAPGSPKTRPSESQQTPAEMYGRFLQVPATRIIPGNVPVNPEIKNPVANQAEAAERGMRYFIAFNCVGCHAPNGGGGMGPSLSNGQFKYGSDPAQIYLTIAHGRPMGMPAWGTILPDSVIWDLVSYVESISQSPSTSWGGVSAWGKTVNENSPKYEQIPAEFKETTTPWQYTRPFSAGRKPE